MQLFRMTQCFAPHAVHRLSKTPRLQNRLQATNRSNRTDFISRHLLLNRSRHSLNIRLNPCNRRHRHRSPQYNAAPTMAAPKHEFFEAYKLYWKNYTNFTDRTRCSDYWYVVLMNLLISGAASLFMFIPVLGYVISTGWALANIIPGLAILVRRLKDTGKDWPYVFFSLIPFVGQIILIVFCAQDSEMGPNQFGPSPKYPYAGGTYAPQQPQYNPTQPNMQNDYAQNNQYPPYSPQN